MRYFVFIAECERDGQEFKKLNDFSFFEYPVKFKVKTLEGRQVTSWIEQIIAGDQARFYSETNYDYIHTWDFTFQRHDANEKTCYLIRIFSVYDTEAEEMQIGQESAEHHAHHIFNTLH